MRNEDKFLSSNTQDFIEVLRSYAVRRRKDEFLSSNTQDFIEVEKKERLLESEVTAFLSSNTQDFIEVG